MASKLPKYTVPSLSPSEGAKVAEVLQDRLHALNDLALTLKHVHWNVVGPHFIAVHEMLDPQVDAVLIAVADQFHVPLARKAITAGKHVLVEKPLGTDLEECEALRDDLILAVSERLNLGQAGIKIEDVPAKIVWFKDKLVPKSVLSLLP